MDILDLTNENFDVTVGTGTVLVDFWASWCMPCRMLAPVIEELAAENDGSTLFAKVNVDDEIGLAFSYGVLSIPTIIIFRDGKEAARFIGVQPKETYAETLELFKTEAAEATAEDTPTEEPGETPASSDEAE